MYEDKDYTDNEDAWTNLALCTEPTVYEGLRFAKDLIIANLTLRFIIQLFPIPQNVRHSFSLLFGGFLLFWNVGPAFAWTAGVTVGAYMCLLSLSFITTRWRGLMISMLLISFLLMCEVVIVNPKMWQQIRGMQMIAAMKIISVAIDLDRGLYKRMLNPLEFGGYILCPANCILGPWISFTTYKQYLDVKFLSYRWIKIINVNLFLSLLFLVLSNCIVPWYIGDKCRWLAAYRDAQAFRMSHYFVSSMSVVAMTCAGFGLTNDCHSELQVTKPVFIELPRSLVQVVIYWNIPMHKWLKNYVFKPCQPYGQFIAVFVTYVASSLLHGLNFQFSAVLVSIGTFSYVEYNFRSKMAAALRACCLANPCTKQCEHVHKKNSLLALFLNSIFSFITVAHLAYLGVMFEASISVQESGYSYLHTLSKWAHLSYASHFFVGVLYIIYLML